MKNYEVVREIFNTCSRKFKLDRTFQPEWETDSIEALMASWYGGELPKFTCEEQPDGTLVYTLDFPLPERYSFTEF